MASMLHKHTIQYHTVVEFSVDSKLNVISLI